METNPAIEAVNRRIQKLERSRITAEEKLVRFQQFLDAFPFGIYIVNERYHIEYTNSLIQKLFGVPNGLKCHQFFHDRETPCKWCKNERVFKGETVIWYWHSEKTNRDYELFDLPLKNDDGSISKIEVFNDITKRVRLASELARFKLAVEQSADGIIISDLEGSITYTNAAAENIYGYGPGGMIGQHIKTLHVDEQTIEDFIIPRIKSTGQWSGELTLKKDGSAFNALISCTAIKEDGQPDSILSIIRDITELKRLAQEQERALTLLEKVYESLDEAVFAVDPVNGKILSCNAASEKIFGYRKNEMIGKNIRFLHVDKKACREYEKNRNRALASGTEFHVECSVKRKDGTVLPAGHVVKAVQDASGLPPIHVVVIKDLTFRKLAERQLEQQQEELRNRAQRLEELNAALKVLLDQREKEKKDRETQLSERVNGLIIPTINRMRKNDQADNQKALLDILEANISEITKPASQKLSRKLLMLSPAESTTADLIKLGYRTKEIASKMGISARTVEFHRDNIRKKLHIKGRKVNLKTYLSRIP